MTDILLDKGVHETKDSKSCVYLLDDEDMFSQLGYKVMLSQKAANLLNAAKLRHNGQTELIYLTKGYQTFAGILPSLPKDGILEVCTRVVQAILNVKDQGFLACANIDVSIERIYFHPKTHEARLVYLPLVAGEDNEDFRFETSVRQLLLQMIKQSNQAVSEREHALIETLSNGTADLEAIDQLLRSSAADTAQNSAAGILSLISTNPNLQMEFAMKGEQMCIGRKKTNDVVLDFSNRISRLHCTVQKRGRAYYVRDEESSFGTGLNGKRLPAEQPIEIKDGDMLMLPGVQFRVKIG